MPQKQVFKICALAALYGIAAESLGRRLADSPARGRELLELHHCTYAHYWAWSDSVLDTAMLRGSLQAAFGWTLHVGPDVVAETGSGRVRAGAAVLAVNAATRGVKPLRARLSVTSSHVVLTEPVPDVLEELGWTGVALKTCKTLTGALLSLCWARAHGMTLMVQDLTNPMLAQIPHALLGAHAGTIMGVETNSMQFCPAASRPEAAVHPGLYRRRDGRVDLSTVRGSGFGYRVGEIHRDLPEPAAEAVRP